MILSNKVAMVTGSGRGIGKGIAEALANEGAAVVSTDIDKKLALKTARAINQKGGTSLGLKLDVTSAAEIRRAVQSTLKEFSRLDILVNNAGISLPVPLLKMSEKIWDRTIEVNLKGIFLCSQAAARIMARRGSGKIINISSVAGQYGAPGLGAYCAAKHGVIGLTKVLAIELGKYNICVNAVCPGNTETEMLMKVFQERARERGQTPQSIIQGIKDKTPLGRFGKPQDVAHLVVFLASSRSDYLTGQAINICGGRSINLS